MFCLNSPGSPPYDSIGVLSYIIKRCSLLGYDVNFTKAQKLLYCCYGTVLGQFGLRLCKEHPKAWQYGPAFPRAYSAHRKNRIDFDELDPISNSNCPDYVKYMVDETIRHFGRYNATSLSDWTHQPGSPWSICSNHGEHLYGDLSDAIIGDYFRTQVIDNYDGPAYPGQQSPSNNNQEGA